MTEQKPASQQPMRATLPFRLLLVLSLWQGPIPWGHEHAAEAHGLATHLAIFHAADGPCADLGWHWHLLLPGFCQEATSEEQAPLFPPLRETLAQLAVLPAGQALSATESAAPLTTVWLDPGEVTGLFDAVARPDQTGFLSSYARACSPQQWLCRLSC